MSIPKVTLSSSFLEYPYSPVISSPQGCQLREKLTIEQIEHNFNSEHTVVRTVEIAPRKPSLKLALALHRTSEIYFLAKLIITGVTAYGLSVLSKKCRISINEILISPVIYQVFITVIASIYVANLIQKLVRQINSPCTFIQVVSSPTSLSKVAVEGLKNNKNADKYCDPYTQEPFSSPINAPRLIVCGKHIFDLPSLLTNMLQKVDEDGNIPHPLYDRFLYKEGTTTPLYNEFLSHEEKEQFLIDVSAFLSIPKDRLAKCWNIKLTEAQQKILNRERTQLDLETKHVQKLEQILQEEISIDLKHFSPKVIVSSLNEARKLVFLESKKALIRQRQQGYFLNLVPPAIVLKYFGEMVKELEKVFAQESEKVD